MKIDSYNTWLAVHTALIDLQWEQFADLKITNPEIKAAAILAVYANELAWSALPFADRGAKLYEALTHLIYTQASSADALAFRTYID